MRLIGSLALILGATLLPLSIPDNGGTPPSWCLACGGQWLSDAIVNVALFVPLGSSLASQGRRPLAVATLGLGLSLAIELLQSLGLPPGRSPSVLDLLANTSGALAGAALFRARRDLWRPTRERAGGLVGGWSALVVLTFFSTGAALRVERALPPPEFRRSPFDYSPGFGWFGGSSENALVNGVPFRHRGQGPIVVESSGALDTIHVELTVSGRDRATYARAAFYLHLAGDSSARLIILQRNEAVQLVVQRRAATWGLNVPSISLPDAFAGHARSNRVRIVAQSRSDALVLAADAGSWRDRTALALTPLLGWTLIQGLVRSSEGAWGTLMEVLWLCLLLAPIGWWAAQSGRPGITLAGAIACASGALVIAPLVLGVASVSPLQWVLMGVIVAGGFLMGGRRTGRDKRGILRS